MNKGFSQEVQLMIAEAQRGYCKTKGCHKRIHSIHHQLHDTSYNRKKFPLFINSPMNGIGLCEKCHTNKSHLYDITDEEAEIYELWLQNLIGGEE